MLLIRVDRGESDYKNVKTDFNQNLYMETFFAMI